MALKCTKLDRSGRARIADFCYRLIGATQNAQEAGSTATSPPPGTEWRRDVTGPWDQSRPTGQAQDPVNARRPSAEPSSPYGDRPGTAERSRRPRRRGREAQGPERPDPYCPALSQASRSRGWLKVNRGYSVTNVPCSSIGIRCGKNKGVPSKAVNCFQPSGHSMSTVTRNRRNLSPASAISSHVRAHVGPARHRAPLFGGDAATVRRGP